MRVFRGVLQGFEPEAVRTAEADEINRIPHGNELDPESEGTEMRGPSELLRRRQTDLTKGGPQRRKSRLSRIVPTMLTTIMRPIGA